MSLEISCSLLVKYLPFFSLREHIHKIEQSAPSIEIHMSERELGILAVLCCVPPPTNIYNLAALLLIHSHRFPLDRPRRGGEQNVQDTVLWCEERGA